MRKAPHRYRLLPLLRAALQRETATAIGNQEHVALARMGCSVAISTNNGIDSDKIEPVLTCFLEDVCQAQGHKCLDLINNIEVEVAPLVIGHLSWAEGSEPKARDVKRFQEGESVPDWEIRRDEQRRKRLGST